MNVPGRHDTIVIDQSLPAERLDSYLREKFPAVSRGTIQRLIEQGHITIDGKQVRATHHPHAGEVVEVYWPEARPAEALPEEIPLEILLEDQDLIVINKKPGMVVHPAAGNEEHTLVNALLHHCRGQLSGIGGVARPGIVHRIDKDTSGCLVVAKNDNSHLKLAEQFAGRTIEKIYQAILCGELPREKGQIHAAIARHPTHRKLMAVTSDQGREARTDYRLLQRLNSSTLVEATLHTGRTHQIRVHFLHLGFPLVGDATYGKRHNARLKEMTGYAAPRQMLHAFKVGFLHPRTGKKIRCSAPLPEDFLQALKLLSLEKGAA